MKRYSEPIRFVRSLTGILLVIAVCDLLIGSGLRMLYERQRSGLLYRTTYSIDSTKADYLVFGSSRANHHYDPREFEPALGSSFYNCGRDAQGALFSSAVASAVISRYSPRCIIIDIRPDEFTRSDEGTLSTLLPYHRNPAIRPYLDFNGKFENVKLLSSIYPYNSLFTNLLVGLKSEHEKDYNGYIELNTYSTTDSIITISEPKGPETAKIRAFDDLMAVLNRRRIPTLLIISPVYAHNILSTTPATCAELEKKYPFVHYYNFTNDRDWLHREEFSNDDFHLNKTGAARFSRKVAELVRQATK